MAGRRQAEQRGGGGRDVGEPRADDPGTRHDAGADQHQRHGDDLGLEAAVAAAVAVAVIGDHDQRVVGEIDGRDHAGQRRVGLVGRGAVLVGVAAVGVTGRVDDADQQHRERIAGREDRARRGAKAARPRRVAGIAERAGQIDPHRGAPQLGAVLVGLVEGGDVDVGRRQRVELRRHDPIDDRLAQEQAGQGIVVAGVAGGEAGGARAIHQRVELDGAAVAVGADAGRRRRRAGQDRHVVRPRPGRVLRRRLAVDAAAAERGQERQGARDVEPQAVDDHDHHAARQRRRHRRRDHRRRLRERRVRQLEIVHEVGARSTGDDRRPRADHQQRDRGGDRPQGRGRRQPPPRRHRSLYNGPCLADALA